MSSQQRKSSPERFLGYKSGYLTFLDAILTTLRRSHILHMVLKVNRRILIVEVIPTTDRIHMTFHLQGTTLVQHQV